MQYSLDQYTLIPKTKSPIFHRSEIQLYRNEKLPIFVAPMTCILNKDNFKTYSDSAFTPIYPIRYNESAEYRIKFGVDFDCWVSVSLVEFIEYFAEGKANVEDQYKILIDCADGHLEAIFDAVKKAKEKFPHLTVMTGNIANTETYLECCKAGIDYVRVGIGGGSGCTTSVQSGFHASMGWLLEGIANIKGLFVDPPFDFNIKCVTKVVADGGINTFAKAVKALALGADYVMIGKMFAQCEESCGRVRYSLESSSKGVPYKEYYGQSSEKGQIDRFGIKKSNPEGIETRVPVEWKLESLTRKFEEVFGTALSYGAAHNFDEFIGKVQYDIVSDSEFRSYNK